MEGSTIRHSAVLVLALVDTASGKDVTGPDASFFDISEEARQIFPIRKDKGYYVVANSPRISFRLLVKAKGYEDYALDINYEEIDEADPLVGIYLTPKADSKTDSLMTLSGRMNDLKEISAVNLDEVVAHGERYDKRRQTLITFEQNYRLNMNLSPYGVLALDQQSFEKVFITRLPKPNEAKLRAPMEGDFARNSSLIRVQYGQILEDGSFIFRVYKRNKPEKFLFRVETGEGVTYKTIDLNNMEAEEEWQLS